MEIDNLTINDLIKKVDSNKIKMKSEEQVTSERIDDKESLKKHIDNLSSTEVTLLNDYFAGKAEIQYKNKAFAEEAMNDWLGKMSTKLCINYEQLLDSSSVKDKDKVAVLKEIFLRVSPPKQEIVIHNKYRDKSDYSLLTSAQKTVAGIEKSFKKIGVKDVA